MATGSAASVGWSLQIQRTELFTQLPPGALRTTQNKKWKLPALRMHTGAIHLPARTKARTGADGDFVWLCRACWRLWQGPPVTAARASWWLPRLSRFKTWKDVTNIVLNGKRWHMIAQMYCTDSHANLVLKAIMLLKATPKYRSLSWSEGWWPLAASTCCATIRTKHAYVNDIWAQGNSVHGFVVR